MFCLRNLRKSCAPSVPARFIQKADYSRRNNDDTRTIVVNFNQDSYKNFDNTVVTEYDPNWELLTPSGYRFYLPGSIGHGWSDAGSTIRMEFQNMLLDGPSNETAKSYHKSCNEPVKQTILCEAQECPKLLRKDVKELFPAWLEVMFPEMTIVTIVLKPKCKKARWSRVMEHEDVVKSFVLSASYISNQLRLARHWADFINPFSGKPHIGQQKMNETVVPNNRLNRSNFKIENNNSCKMISPSKTGDSFVGCLYTTAPWNNPFLQELMSDVTEN